MDNGTAYGLNNTEVKSKEPPQPDPTIRATCYLDTTSLNDGYHKVWCLVILRSDELLGLLVQPFHKPDEAAEQEIPQYERVGMFYCDRFDFDFANLDAKIQGMLLV